MAFFHPSLQHYFTIEKLWQKKKKTFSGKENLRVSFVLLRMPWDITFHYTNALCVSKMWKVPFGQWMRSSTTGEGRNGVQRPQGKNPPKSVLERNFLTYIESVSLTTNLTGYYTHKFATRTLLSLSCKSVFPPDLSLFKFTWSFLFYLCFDGLDSLLFYLCKRRSAGW